MSNVTKIESEAFYDCQVLTSVPTEHVTSIGQMAFWDCKLLEEIKQEYLQHLK